MASTATTTQHTATPWRVVNGIFIRDEIMPFDRDDRDTALIATASGYGTIARDEANAAFIVRACNSHNQLVAALTEALATIDDYLAYEHNGDPWTEDARAMGEMDIDDYANDGRLDRARAALTAAGA